MTIYPRKHTRIEYKPSEKEKTTPHADITNCEKTLHDPSVIARKKHAFPNAITPFFA